MHRQLAAALIAVILILSGFTAYAGELSFEALYPATVGGAATALTAHFDGEWFEQPSGEYSHDIAKLSIAMAMAAFRNNSNPDAGADVYIRGFFDALGCEGYRETGYDSTPSSDSVSSALAYLRLDGYVLVFSPVCGQGYGNEWLSNFTVDDSVNHAGFESAAKQVHARIDEYVSELFPGERVKLLITGFSRAAAVSNLLGAMIAEDGCYGEGDVYVYCFGTPNNTRAASAYPGIHNICGSFDPVTRVPYVDWGFSKHGTTHYLTAPENDADYSLKLSKAKAVYESLTGSDDFGAIPERNWLIAKLLKLFCDCIPESSAYSGAMQDVLKAAWMSEGSLISKLELLTGVFSETGKLHEGYQRIRDELLELVNLGITDTVRAAYDGQGSLMWYELLNSGMNLAKEHFPEVYYSWLYSSDSGEALYTRETTYRKLIITGDTAVRVYLYDRAARLRTEVMNTVSGVQDIAAVSLTKQRFIYLPEGNEYEIMVTTGDSTEVQIGYCAPVTGGALTESLLTTNEITLYDGDYMLIRAGKTADSKPEVLVNGSDMLTLSDTKGGVRDLLMRGTLDASAELMTQISAALVLVLYLLLGVILVLYVLAVLVKRLVRGSLTDNAVCRTAGGVLLAVTSLISVSVALSFLYQLYSLVSNSGSYTVPYRTLQRASEYLGIGTAAYLTTGLVLYSLMSLECIMSIHNQLNRVRLSRLSIALCVLNTLTAVLSQEIHTNAVAEYLTYAVPLLALISLKLAYIKGADQTIKGIVWLPLSRTVTWTAILFMLRQAIVFIFGIELHAAVALKAMTSIPVLVLAVRMFLRKRCTLMKFNLLGVSVYLIANTVINLSPPAGVFIYVIGHVLMVRGYMSVRRVTPLQVIVWVLLTGLLGYEIWFFRAVLPEGLLPFALIYDAVMCAMLVTAFPLSGHYRLGTLLFLLANELLLLTYLYPGGFTIACVELLVFYAAVIFMTTDPETMRSPWERQQEEYRRRLE